MASHFMRKVKIEELTVPRHGLFSIHVDDWWFVSGDDEVYFYATRQSPFASPQCNGNRIIVESRLKAPNFNTGVGPLGQDYSHLVMENLAGSRQLPLIYVPVNLSDYQY